MSGSSLPRGVTDERARRGRARPVANVFWPPKKLGEVITTKRGGGAVEHGAV